MFYYDLRSVAWKNLYQLPSCSGKFRFFDKVISLLIEEHLPWKEVERNVNDKPWVTDHYRGLCIQKHNANLTGDTRTYETK
jgi:hypothetical protein